MYSRSVQKRLLCREVKVNLAYRWFCGLGLEDKIPDHSAFSRARNERFRDSDIFRRVFDGVVEACIAAGLVGGQGFAVDASLIVADANKQRSIPGSEWNKERDARGASRAVKEYLATLDDAAFGAASNVTPKFVSPSDPAAQWTGAMRKLARYNSTMSSSSFCAAATQRLPRAPAHGRRGGRDPGMRSTGSFLCLRSHEWIVRCGDISGCA
jgi:hypothetical protein